MRNYCMIILVLLCGLQGHARGMMSVWRKPVPLAPVCESEKPHPLSERVLSAVWRSTDVLNRCTGRVVLAIEKRVRCVCRRIAGFPAQELADQMWLLNDLSISVEDLKRLEYCISLPLADWWMVPMLKRKFKLTDDQVVLFKQWHAQGKSIATTVAEWREVVEQNNARWFVRASEAIMRGIGRKKAGFDAWYKQTTLFSDVRNVGKLLKQRLADNHDWYQDYPLVVDCMVMNDAFGNAH